VDGASFEQLRVYLRAALLSISARHPAYSEPQCWHALFARYCECWQQLHGPLALAAAGSSGSMGVVRGGLMLSLLRSGTKVEEEEGGGGGGAAHGSRSYAAVRSCLQAISQALGSPVQRLMMRLVAAGVDLEGSLLPGMVDLLLYGPQPPQQGEAGAGSGGDGARRRLAEWRASRQAALLHVQQALDAVPDPVQAIKEFAEDLLLSHDERHPAGSTAAAAAPGQAPQLPAPLGTALCSSVLQASRARCLVAQRLLLLLGLVERIGRAGSAALSPEQQAVAREQLVPGLTTALRSAAMALWLTKTPAACPLGPGAGAAAASAAVLPQHLEALQLGAPGRGGGGGGSVAGTPRTPGGPSMFASNAPGTQQQNHNQQQQQRVQQRQLSQQSLAAHLLRGFCESYPSEAAGASAGRVGPAVVALLSYLCSGAEAARSSSNSSSSSSSTAAGIEVRALHVGWRLFCAREFAGVGTLVDLAGGPTPADAGLAFLLGVSLACRLRGFGGSGAGGEAARRELLDAASGHLFRAAAGLAAPEAAPLRTVLHQLRRRQQRGGGSAAGGLDLAPPSSDGGSGDAAAGGGAGAGGVVPEAVPRLRLEFFEAVMRLFESEECLEGALEFARAALGAVDGAYGEGDAARRERQGMSVCVCVCVFGGIVEPGWLAGWSPACKLHASSPPVPV